MTAFKFHFTDNNKKQTINDYLTELNITGKDAYKVYKAWKKSTNRRNTCTTWLNYDSSMLIGMDININL